jgi:hypothetical protein
MALRARRAASVLSLLAAVCAVAGTSSFTGDNSYNYTAHATRLNRHLLNDYDMHVPPMSWRTNTTAAKSAAGTDVSMQIRFYKIESVEAARGHMNLKVWLRYSWHDDRLSWDPADFGGATSTYFLAVGHNKPEETKIWVPDLAVYNLAAGINDELEGQMVVVHSNGQVAASRSAPDGASRHGARVSAARVGGTS